MFHATPSPELVVKWFNSLSSGIVDLITKKLYKRHFNRRGYHEARPGHPDSGRPGLAPLSAPCPLFRKLVPHFPQVPSTASTTDRDIEGVGSLLNFNKVSKRRWEVRLGPGWSGRVPGPRQVGARRAGVPARDAQAVSQRVSRMRWKRVSKHFRMCHSHCFQV